MRNPKLSTEPRNSLQAPQETYKNPWPKSKLFQKSPERRAKPLQEKSLEQELVAGFCLHKNTLATSNISKKEEEEEEIE